MDFNKEIITISVVNSLIVFLALLYWIIITWSTVFIFQKSQRTLFNIPLKTLHTLSIYEFKHWKSQHFHKLLNRKVKRIKNLPLQLFFCPSENSVHDLGCLKYQNVFFVVFSTHKLIKHTLIYSTSRFNYSSTDNMILEKKIAFSHDLQAEFSIRVDCITM